jgi:hypothetical protein
VAIYSPQSQKLAVGSEVIIYTSEAIRKMIHPMMLLIREKLFILWLVFILRHKDIKIKARLEVLGFGS